MSAESSTHSSLLTHSAVKSVNAATFPSILAVIDMLQQKLPTPEQSAELFLIIAIDAICTTEIQVTRYKKQLDDAMQRRARLKDQLESCLAKFQAKGFDSKPHIEKRLQAPALAPLTCLASLLARLSLRGLLLTSFCFRQIIFTFLYPILFCTVKI